MDVTFDYGRGLGTRLNSIAEMEMWTAERNANPWQVFSVRHGPGLFASSKLSLAQLLEAKNKKGAITSGHFFLVALWRLGCGRIDTWR